MLLKEIKVTGVNPAVTWLDKKLQKLGYETSISLRGSVSKQYIHVISGTKSATIRVLDPSLPSETNSSMNHDVTLLIGIDLLSKKKRQSFGVNRPNTFTNPEDIISFIKNKV